MSEHCSPFCQTFSLSRFWVVHSTLLPVVTDKNHVHPFLTTSTPATINNPKKTFFSLHKPFVFCNFLICHQNTKPLLEGALMRLIIFP